MGRALQHVYRRDRTASLQCSVAMSMQTDNLSLNASIRLLIVDDGIDPKFDETRLLEETALKEPLGRHSAGSRVRRNFNVRTAFTVSALSQAADTER